MRSSQTAHDTVGALRDRRSLLALRRRRADASRLFRSISPSLCAEDVRFSPCSIARCSRQVEAFGFALRDEHVDWSHIAQARREQWQSDCERGKLFRQILSGISQPEERSLVVFHPSQVGLILATRDLVSQETYILGAHDTLWIMPASRSRQWFAEVSEWEQELRWVVRRPRADKAAEEDK